ncbi:MAG: tetratricopeptide repeat protein [Bacteroidetes bacterium]|nr:tetratricopeptide repeat protein [Bacteroidota bacterium]
MLFKKPVFLLFALLLFSPLYMNAQGPGAAFARDGQKFMKAKQFEDAVRKFDEAIRAENSNFRYYVMKAQCLMQLKRNEEAIAAFEGATRVNPGFADGYYASAMLYARQRDTDRAVQNLDKAFDAETDQTKKLKYKLTAAKMLVAAGKNNEALAALNQAKSIQPNDTRIVGTEGSIHLKASNWQAAYDAYSKAEQLAKQQQQTGCALGNFTSGKAVAAAKLGRDSDYKNAIEELKTTCPKLAVSTERKVKATGSGRFLAVASGYLNARAYDEAIQWINKAVEANDNPAATYKFAAIAYYKAGQTSAAVDYYKKAAEAQKTPEDQAKMYSQLANIQFANNDFSGTISSIDKVLATNPNSSNLLFIKAQAQYKQGQYAAAVATAQQALQLIEGKAPAQVTAQYNFFIGLAAKKGGDTATAATALRKAAVGGFKLAATEELNTLPK